MNELVDLPTAKLLKQKGFDDYEWDPVTDTSPTVLEVTMWLYEKHGIWIEVTTDIYGKFCWLVKQLKASNNNFDSPTEAYFAAIEYTLKNLI